MIYGMVKALDCEELESGDYYVAHCSNDDDAVGTLVVGALAFSALRVSETIDAFVEPSKHNRKVRQLRASLGLPVPLYDTRLLPFMAPTLDREGGIAGVSLRF